MTAFTRRGRSVTYARNGMVCSSHALASDVGLDVLKAGGNAFDAALAAVALQCVVEPGSTGIGGDCFAMLGNARGGQPIAFNGSGRAPAAVSVQALNERGVHSLERGSPHAVTVPGAADAWVRLHADHGRMPLSELLAPAVSTARTGWPMGQRVAFDTATHADFLRGHARAASIYLDQGQAPAPGSLRRLPALADTLEQVAREGRAPFYAGELARGMVDELQALGGLHTLGDFASAAGEYVTPIAARFRDLTVWECPPNGQGLIALLLLKMFERLPVGHGDPLSPERIHLEIEACRLAYGVRAAYLADPAVAAVPVDRILSDAHVEQLLASIDPACATVPPAAPALPPHRDTVYVSAVDGDGFGVSLINTLFHCYGAGITSRDGITFTNRGQGFSMDPASPNVIAGGKRPLHTIIPALAHRGDRLALVFGVMGGEYQAMGHLQFLTRHVDYGLDVQAAMELPRFMVDPFTGRVELEAGVPTATREALIGMGHDIALPATPIGGSQAIAIDADTGVLYGGSDPRKDGCAAGY